MRSEGAVDGEANGVNDGAPIGNFDGLFVGNELKVRHMEEF